MTCRDDFDIIYRLLYWQQKQLRANKRQEVLFAKRKLGTAGHPPHLVVVVSLSEHVDVYHVHSLLCGACDLDDPTPIMPPSTLISPSLRHRFTVAYPSTCQLYTLLDVAKVRGLYLDSDELFSKCIGATRQNKPHPLPLI